MKVFITGITGSLGAQVTSQLLERPDVEVFGYSRDELRQQKFLKHPRVTLTLGDVRDRSRLLEATRGMDMIMHFAALKHVDLIEANPEESVRTNIEGTENVLHAQRIHKIPRVVLSSTDKAVEPINVYGASKLVAERLVLRNPNNVVTRYGNVMASNGSVIPTFVRTIRDEGKAYLTDQRMTRFWIRLEDAAKFVIESAFGERGGLFIPPMKAARVLDVACAVASILGKTNLEVVDAGMRPGEKLAESLVSEYEGEALRSDNCLRFTNRELQDLLAPVVGGLA